MNIQLGSITDQQVRATTKMTNVKGDTSIDQINIDQKTKNKLRKIGVTSVDDLNQLESKKVDIARVSDDTIDFKTLANQIQKSRRNQNPPMVRSVSLSLDDNNLPYLHLKGQNFSLNQNYPPVAVLNNKLAEVVHSSSDELKIALNKSHISGQENELILTLDPYAIVKMNIRI